MTQNLSCGGWRPGCACPQSDFLTHNLSGAWIVHGRLPVNSNFELLQIAPRKELVRRVYAVVALNTENVQKRLIAFYVFIKLDVGALKHKPTKPVGELEVQAQQREIVRVRVASRVAEASGKRAVIHVQVLRQHRVVDLVLLFEKLDSSLERLGEALNVHRFRFQLIHLLFIDKVTQVEPRLLHIVGVVIHPSENITSYVLLDVNSDEAEAALIDMRVRPVREQELLLSVSLP